MTYDNEWHKINELPSLHLKTNGVFKPKTMNDELSLLFCYGYISIKIIINIIHHKHQINMNDRTILKQKTKP